MKDELFRVRRLANLLVIGSVVLFIAMFLLRVSSLSEDTERISVRQFTTLVNGALTHRMLTAAINGELDHLPQLQGANPMDFFATAPEGYAGRFTNPSAKQVAHGRWYYDPQAQAFAYRPINETFRVMSAQEDLLFQVQFFFTDKNANQRFEAQIDDFDGLRLVPLKNYPLLADKST